MKNIKNEASMMKYLEPHLYFAISVYQDVFKVATKAPFRQNMERTKNQQKPQARWHHQAQVTPRVYSCAILYYKTHEISDTSI